MLVKFIYTYSFIHIFSCYNIKGPKCKQEKEKEILPIICD